MLQNYNIAKKSQLNWQKLQVNNTKNDILIQEKNLFNQWHDFILHAKWGENGFFKLYVNGDLTYIEEGHITNIYRYNNKLYGPSFRYGIYQNNAPKEFEGKISYIFFF